MLGISSLVASVISNIDPPVIYASLMYGTDKGSEFRVLPPSDEYIVVGISATTANNHISAVQLVYRGPGGSLLYQNAGLVVPDSTYHFSLQPGENLTKLKGSFEEDTLVELTVTTTRNRTHTFGSSTENPDKTFLEAINEEEIFFGLHGFADFNKCEAISSMGILTRKRFHMHSPADLNFYN
jgi:hypothetical protein